MLLSSPFTPILPLFFKAFLIPKYAILLIMEEILNGIMIFGVFDNLHDGHRFLINQAYSYGSNLYIVVTPTQTVKKLKGNLPYYSIKERISSLAKEYPDATVIEGDAELGLWTPIVKHKPKRIVCGYDQKSLYEELQKIQDKYQFEIVQIAEDHQGSKLHSRYINKGV